MGLFILGGTKMAERYSVKAQVGEKIKEAVSKKIEEVGILYYETKEMKDGSLLVEIEDLKYFGLEDFLKAIREVAPEEATDENDAYHVIYIGDEGHNGDEWNGDDYFNLSFSICGPDDTEYTSFAMVKLDGDFDVSEITEHLAMNGYTYETNGESVIFISGDELDYLKTILDDRNVQYDVA